MAEAAEPAEKGGETMPGDLDAVADFWHTSPPFAPALRRLHIVSDMSVALDPRNGASPVRVGRILALLISFAVLCGMASATALAEGWSLRNLLPASKEQKPSARKLTHKANSGTQTIAGKRVNGNLRKKPGPLESFTGGAKRLASKTKSMFTSNKKPAEVHKVTGRQALHKRSDKTSKKPAGIGSWFGQNEPPPPPASIKEWLALPRSDL
jgi:hypothetical protein